MDHSARSVQIQRRSEFWRPKKNVTQPAALIVPTRPPTRTTRPTVTPGKYVFLGNLPKNPYPAPAPDPLPVDPNLLTGMAAVTAAASATATALFMRQKREEELRRIADESRAEAEARARAANQAKIQAHLEYLAKTKSEKLQKGKAENTKKRPIQATSTIPAFVNIADFNKPNRKLSSVMASVSTIFRDDGKSPRRHFTSFVDQFDQENLPLYNQHLYTKTFFQYYLNSKEYHDLFNDSNTNYGFMGCGAVSVCEGLEKIAESYSLPFNVVTCTAEFYEHLTNHGFTLEKGIQPKKLLIATEEFLGEDNETMRVFKDTTNLKVEQIDTNDFYEAVGHLYINSFQNNQAIIVDVTAKYLLNNEVKITLDSNGRYNFEDINVPGTEITGTDIEFSHFTLYRGYDPINNRFLFSETLYQPSGGEIIMVPVSQEGLVKAWLNPEIRAMGSGSDIDEVGYWMLKITGETKK